MSPQTACTTLAQIAQESGREDLHPDGQQQPCRLVGSSPARLMVLLGPSLTNRMSELLTYGSVGGVGRKPGSYPAANAGGAHRLDSRASRAARIAESHRWTVLPARAK